MKTVNDLIKVPELNQTMQTMSREMMKAGLIEETMGEMMDDVFDTDDIEEDADAEVDKVCRAHFASAMHFRMIGFDSHGARAHSACFSIAEA